MKKKNIVTVSPFDSNTRRHANPHFGRVSEPEAAHDPKPGMRAGVGSGSNARRKFIRSCATIAASFVMPPLALASTPKPPRHSALLVGVSEYPTLGRRQQLAGPKNDIAAWLRYFDKRAPAFTAENIDVVADGVAAAGARLPTRANIISALDRAVARARFGDFQLVYFAGHGSQMMQPVGAAHPEADGLDEIFLPRDIGRWDGSIGRVANAVIDDEIGDRLDAMRAQGTDVFAVFDCCHAATMARADAMTKTRGVSALDLGMQPPATPRGIRTTGGTKLTASSTGAADRGALTVFYAAHSHQSATEEHLPREKVLRTTSPSASQTNGTGTWRGVFSFHLIETLSSHPMSLSNEFNFRELAEKVSRRYVQEQRVTPVPRYEFLAAVKA